MRREYPTDIGPVDLLCRDGDDRAVVVEVKRVGEIAGVEQLLRYQERLDLDPTLAPTIGLFVATRIKPQARCSPRAEASCASRSTSSGSAAARRSTCGSSDERDDRALLEARPALLEEGGEPFFRVGRLARPGHHVEGVLVCGALVEADLGVEGLLAERLRSPAAAGRTLAAG